MAEKLTKAHRKPVTEVVIHQGHVVARVEEDGRRFWAVVTHDRAGWPFRHEFCSASEAKAFLDQRLQETTHDR